MTDPTLPEHVVDYINHALDAADSGQSEPPPYGLTADELEAARLILAEITPVGDIDVDIPPLTEDLIAIRLGIAAEPPPVAIDITALNSALQGVDVDQLTADLSRYGHTADAGWLNELCDGTIEALSPIVLRTLAALLGTTPDQLALNSVERFPASERHHLDLHLHGTEWTTEADGDAVMLASAEHRLGLLVAHVPTTDALTTLNVRRVAWEYLTGLWAHTSACAVVSPVDDWHAVIIDAIDCQPHQSAPSGILTYGPDLEIHPLPVALDTYAARYRVSWTPPQPLPRPASEGELIHRDATCGLHTLLTLSRRAHEAKRTAWAEVRDQVTNLEPQAWLIFADVEPTTVGEDIEAMLETVIAQ